jgi:hypothetical protein
MCSVDFDPAQVWECWSPRARKPHRCSECGYTIKPGESYARVNALSDGSWWTAVRCSACYFLCELIEETECDGHGQILWGGDGLQEEVREFYGEYDDNDNHTPHWARVAYDALCARAEASP